MRRFLICLVLALPLAACQTTGTERSIEQRVADRETLRTILQYCEVTITGHTEATVNASVLPSANAGLNLSLGGNCKPIPYPGPLAALPVEP